MHEKFFHILSFLESSQSTEQKNSVVFTFCTMYSVLPQKQHQQHQLSNPFNQINLLVILLSLLILLGVFFPWLDIILGSISSRNQASLSKWRDYTLAEAALFVAKDRLIIVCAVSKPYQSLLSNWLISVSRHKHQDKVLVIAEDYDTLYKINEKWPGHAVLIPPAPDAEPIHYFGSEGFYNFTTRRPRHLLNLLELGYTVLYSDVDMVWIADPFPHIKGHHDIYFGDDADWVKKPSTSTNLPVLGTIGNTNYCTCFIFLRPTSSTKQLINKWIEGIQIHPWFEGSKSQDQLGFNWALNQIAGQVDVYLLPQTSFPSGELYFKKKEWLQENKGSIVIAHNNYIIGFQNKVGRLAKYGLWLVDDHADKSPLGRL